MNRYEEIKKIADRYYNGIENDENRALCFEHSQAVADCAKEIAEKENYNPELVQIAGCFPLKCHGKRYAGIFSFILNGRDSSHHEFNCPPF